MQIPASRPSFLQLGWRSLLRDLRAGELRLVIIAVMLAVAALTGVSFFADRLNGQLVRDARQLLGGDAVIVSDQPTPEPLTQLARTQGLQVSQTLSFPTMARADDVQGGTSRLVALKAVGAGYPLRGQVMVKETMAAPARASRALRYSGTS